MEHIFTEIYKKKIWGDNEQDEYQGSSGSGSDVGYNKTNYIPFLKEFIKVNTIKSVIDLGCGDFRCGRLLYDDLDIKYTGYDTYKDIVQYNTNTCSLPKYTFYHLDFFSKKEQLESADLYILKDVLQHWSLECIYTFLDYIIEQKKFKYLLIINCCISAEDNKDIENGSARPLSCNFFPLKKYNAQYLFQYKTKEVSLIQIERGVKT